MNIITMADLERTLRKLLICAKDEENLPLLNINGCGYESESKNLCQIENPRLSNTVSNFLILEEYEKVLCGFFKSQQYQNETITPATIDSILAEGPMERHLELISIGVAALQLFVQINWAGRNALNEPETATNLKDFSELPKEEVNQLLVDAVNGEGIESVCQNIELLYIAIVCLLGKGGVENAFKDSWSTQWWQFRCLSVHQQTLTEKSDVIYQQALKLIGQIEKYFEDYYSNDSKLVSTAKRESLQLYMLYFNLEVSAFYANYFDIANMTKYIEKAALLNGFQIEETGVLGKRTKFQENNLPQFTLNFFKERLVNEKSELNTMSSMRSGAHGLENSLPKDLKLDDEVRLDKIMFANERQTPDLSMDEQCLVFAIYNLVKKSKPKDDLANEQLLPYLEAILSSNLSIQIWALRTNALLERSKLEKDNRRTIERSLMQIETLTDSIRVSNNLDNGFHKSRMHLIYATKLPPYWHFETELVRLYQSMGSIKSALDVALRMELWEDVISCYHLLKLKHKAAEVIENQIKEKGETPLLLCMLGDATDDEEQYRKALVISSNKSSRAYKALGMNAYYRKDYREAVKLLDKSLDINRFQPDILLRLGYASLEIEDWSVAARTYRLYCNFEPDNFEAWNNLANAYIKLNQKSRAFTVMLEAVKCDYDNWKLWDNILCISVDCGHFEESIRAYHRILDIRESKSQNSFEGNTKMKELVDVGVLSALVQAVTSNEILDTFGQSAMQVHGPGLIKLFGRIATMSPKHEMFYELYAQLVLSRLDFKKDNDSDEKAEIFFKATQMMQRSTAAFQTNHQGWEKSLEECNCGIKLFIKYGKYCLEGENVQQLVSAKMSTKSVLSKVKKNQISIETGEVKYELQGPCHQLEEIIEQIVSKLNELK